MMPWQLYLIVAVAAMECAICWTYNYMQKQWPQYSLWVVMGSWLVKLLVVVIAVLAVHFLTDLPLKEFALWMLGCIMVGLVFETFFFLKKKQ